jgi:protein Shroom
MFSYFRTSSASEYSTARDKLIQQRQQLSKDLLGPMIMGPIISVDDWIPPERPPKNPMLRIPSPEPPLPPPPPAENIVIPNQDEPLPPPPPEILKHVRQLSDSGEPKSNPASRRNSFAGQTNKVSIFKAVPTNPKVPPAVPKKPTAMQILGLPQKRPSSSMAQPQFAHTHDIFQAQANAGRLSDSRWVHSFCSIDKIGE